MQKTILLFAVMVMAIISQAQITKGSLLLGGNLAFQSSTSETNGQLTEHKNTRYILSPSVGIATSTNTIFGVGLTFGDGTIKNADFRRNEDSYGAQAFFRKYYPVVKNLYLFGQLSAYYRHYKETDKTNGTTGRILTQNSVGLELYPGLSYALNKKFHLELGITRLANLQYSKNKVSYPNSTVNSGYSRGVEFSTDLSGLSSLSVGMRFLISK